MKESESSNLATERKHGKETVHSTVKESGLQGGEGGQADILPKRSRHKN